MYLFFDTETTGLPMKSTGIIISLLHFSILFGCKGTRPSNLGVRDGKLAPCPDKPNCVSSQSTDQTHSVPPFTYTSPQKDAFADLKRIVSNMNNASVFEESPTYIRSEFTSTLFRFVDDVEFFFDDTKKIIHIRSSSRIGYTVFGVNRKRVEKIREAWKNR